MAADYLLFLQLQDLDWVLKHEPALLDGHRCVCFAPEVFELALRRDVKSVEYRESNLLSGDAGPRLTEYSDARALALDHELSKIREDVFGVENAQGWDYLNFRFLFWRITWFRRLAQYVARTFEPGRKIRIAASQGAQDFLSASAIPAKVFGSELRAFGRGAVEYLGLDCRPWGIEHNTRLLVPDTIAFRERAPHADALVHTPTCFHDERVFRDQIKKRWPRFLDVASPFWDVVMAERPEERIRLRLCPMDHPSRRVRKVAEYETAYRDLVANRLSDLLPAGALEEQVNHLACGASSQAVWFLDLLSIAEELEDKRLPLVISDHEAGLGGPLWTWAQLANATTYVLPHSAAQNCRLPASRNVITISDKRFRYSGLTLHNQDVNTRYVAIRTSEKHLARMSPARIKTIGLLYSVFSVGDVQCESFWGFVDFYKTVSAIAADRGMRTRLRLKPAESAHLFCAKAVGIPLHEVLASANESLEEFAAGCDLGLMIGQPTTAAALFVALGVPLVYVMSSDARRRNWHYMDDARAMPSGVPIYTQHDVLALVNSAAYEPASTASSSRVSEPPVDSPADEVSFFD